MFNYFTLNEMVLNLIFPLIVAIIPLCLTYFLFEPIISLLKKDYQRIFFARNK